ncbi:MAG: BspA family leucine-rich repeat surface protein [Cyclobacteriaceae bacterium]
MKKSINKIWMILLLITFYSCQQEDHPLSELQGTIRFGGISLEFAPMGGPGSRIRQNSPWVHVFPNSADLVFMDKATGQEHVLEYNPNDFSTPNSISLPYGDYEYYSIVEGGIFSSFLPFEAKGEFSLDSQSLEISLEATTEYGLVTVKDQYVEKASLSDGDHETNLLEHENGKYWFLYVKGGTEASLNINESFQGSTIIRELIIEAFRHYHFVLKLNEGAAAITELILALFELEEEEILLGSGSKFFEENGTIKCPGAAPGEKGMVNDKMYEAVDRVLLTQRRDEGADLSCVCTSLVTDMSGMFGDPEFSYITNLSDMFERASDFNQPIGNWDVSNVTDMGRMFLFAANFNQPLGNWDVSKVTNMSAMFMEAVNFNQPIGDWDVSKVTNMRIMFYQALNFNQPIGNWDVSNVTDMGFMISEARRFNQPIGDWDVGNVTNMIGMFYAATNFNQPIGDWDVGKVTNMEQMFNFATNFNQSIGNWDVSKVTNMGYMFSNTNSFNQPIGDWDVSNVANTFGMYGMFQRADSFNQDLSSWCVQNIHSEPSVFSRDSALIEANKPVWGTCPE